MKGKRGERPAVKVATQVGVEGVVAIEGRQPTASEGVETKDVKSIAAGWFPRHKSRKTGERKGVVDCRRARPNSKKSVKSANFKKWE